MSNTHEHKAPKQIAFNNNPFSLAFNEMSKAFKINQNPAITIIVGSMILYVVNQIFSNGPDVLSSIGDGMSSDGAKISLGLIGAFMALISIVLSVLVSNVWAGFTALVGVKNARSESVQTMPSIKTSLSKFGTIFVINLIIGLLVLACIMPAVIVGLVGAIVWASGSVSAAIGLIVASGILLLAGLVFSIRFSIGRSLSLYAVFDEGLGAFEAMKRSTSLTQGRVIEAWGMAFPGAIIPIIGPLLTSCGLGAHYLQLKVYKDNSAELPSVNALSWLPVVFLTGIMILIGLIGLVLIAVSAN